MSPVLFGVLAYLVAQLVFGFWYSRRAGSLVYQWGSRGEVLDYPYLTALAVALAAFGAIGAVERAAGTGPGARPAGRDLRHGRAPAGSIPP